MNTVFTANCNCQFHQEVYALITHLEEKIDSINSHQDFPTNFQNQRDRINSELMKIRELLDFHKIHCTSQNLDTDEEFIQGYQVGRECNQVLYDASQIPIQEVKMALALDLNQNTVPPYLLGIQVGWRVGGVEQSLTRFLPDEKTTLA